MSVRTDVAFTGLGAVSSGGDHGRLLVVGVGEVDSCRADLVDLLALAGDGVRQVDDVHDFGAAEAGDLYGTHAGEARASCGYARVCLSAESLVGGGIVPEAAGPA
jgi:hypothetical protein